MRRFASIVVAPLALFLAACGSGAPDAGRTVTGEAGRPTASQADPGQLYEGNGMVCEDGTRGPLLWLGAVLLSLGPPECGGVPLLNWDWRAVPDEETAGKTIWGTYHVAGSYDGETLVVTDVGPYEDDPFASGTDPDTTSPCDEPEGGRIVTDPAHNTQNDVGAAAAYARSQPDYSTSWNSHLEPAPLEFGPVVFNAVFTGDAERHEAEIRKVWDGSLCVVARDVPTRRELRRIRREVEADLEELGLEMLWSSGPGVEPVIEIGVVADLGGKAQAALDARYGPEIVRVIPALKPVL
jgi:hypothetical protein